MRKKRLSRKAKWWIFAAILGALILLLIWELDLPNWQKLDLDRLTNLAQSTVVYASDGESVGNLYGGENRVLVSIEEIPAYVQQAFIAAEDLRFYEHNGVDVVRIFGALWHDIKTMSLQQGASTITQQLIKLTHLTSDKTLSRKVQEAFLAMQLEKRALQGRNPRMLFKCGLFWKRSLRNRIGFKGVFRQKRLGSYAGTGRAPRRDHQGSEQLCATSGTRECAEEAQYDPGYHGGGGIYRF